jgi:hypothetical protein
MIANLRIEKRKMRMTNIDTIAAALAASFPPIMRANASAQATLPPNIPPVELP